MRMHNSLLRCLFSTILQEGCSSTMIYSLGVPFGHAHAVEICVADCCYTLDTGVIPYARTPHAQPALAFWSIWRWYNLDVITKSRRPTEDFKVTPTKTSRQSRIRKSFLPPACRYKNCFQLDNTYGHLTLRLWLPKIPSEKSSVFLLSFQPKSRVSGACAIPQKK